MARMNGMENEKLGGAPETPEETEGLEGDGGGTVPAGEGVESLVQEDSARAEEPPTEAESEGGLEEAEELTSRSETEILQEELDQLRDRHLRLAADFENYRKRVSADLTTGWVRAQAELAKSLLEGLDDLQRVSQFTTEDATLETLIEGVDLVERKFVKALTDAGLKAVDPTGEAFDPNSMEAMMRVPVEEEGQDETVHQVFQKGYLFKDQLVRPARVSVYKDDD